MENLFVTASFHKGGTDCPKKEQSKSILIADDEPFNLEALEGILNFLGIHKIDKALNGRDALDLVKKNPDMYDMIITDNQMPYIIGIELACQVRQLQASSQVSKATKLVLISGNNINTIKNPVHEQPLFDEVL